MSGFTTATYIALGASALSAGMGAMGQIQQAGAQAGMAGYQAQLARQNQTIAEWNARRAEERGQVAEQQQRLKTAQIIGAQRAALAGQGADINEGSPLDIQADSARAGEFDALTLRSNAATEAYGQRLQAAGYAGTAAAQDAAAANATANLPFAVGSSLLGSAGAIAGKWADWTKGKDSRPVAGDLLSGGTAP